MRQAKEVYNELRSKLRFKLGEDDKEVTELLDDLWDAAYSEGIVEGQSD